MDGRMKNEAAATAAGRAGAVGYDRARILPRLLPIDPAWLADTSPEGHRRILRLIAGALRGERRRGRAGHWTYSLDRHVGLVTAARAERLLAGLARPAARHGAAGERAETSTAGE